MVHDPRRFLALAGVLCTLALAALPATALACPIAIRRIGPLEGSRSDLIRPTPRITTRDAWKLDSSWMSTMPRLSQFITIKGVGTYHGATFKEQRALSIDARGPFDNGWMYFDDSDPDTKPCELTGQIDWQPPKIRVVQGPRQVRIVATTQRTVGDRTGCILGPDKGVRECPNLTRVIVRLAKPLGTRKLVFEVFP